MDDTNLLSINIFDTIIIDNPISEKYCRESSIVRARRVLADRRFCIDNTNSQDSKNKFNQHNTYDIDKIRKYMKAQNRKKQDIENSIPKNIRREYPKFENMISYPEIVRKEAYPPIKTKEQYFGDFNVEYISKNGEKYKKLEDNYDLWLQGVNPVTNRQVQINGTVHKKIKDIFMIKYEYDNKLYSVQFNEMQNQDFYQYDSYMNKTYNHIYLEYEKYTNHMNTICNKIDEKYENYLSEYNIATQKIDEENAIITARNNQIKQVICQINSLNSKAGWVIFNGICYGKQLRFLSDDNAVEVIRDRNRLLLSMHFEENNLDKNLDNWILSETGLSNEDENKIYNLLTQIDSSVSKNVKQCFKCRCVMPDNSYATNKNVIIYLCHNCMLWFRPSNTAKTCELCYEPHRTNSENCEECSNGNYLKQCTMCRIQYRTNRKQRKALCDKCSIGVCDNCGGMCKSKYNMCYFCKFCNQCATCGSKYADICYKCNPENNCKICKKYCGKQYDTCFSCKFPNTCRQCGKACSKFAELCWKCNDY